MKHGACMSFLVAIALATTALPLKAAELKVVTEYRYPTAYEVVPIMGMRNGAYTIVGGIVTPTAFETRETGTILSVEATIGGMGGPNVAMTSLAQLQGNGNTPLMLAATAGNVNTVRQLLQAGVLVNARNRTGSTALMGAAAGGFLEIVRMLVAAGAFLDSPAENGSTPLIFAARNGHTDVVRLLLESGAKPNAADKQGLSALMYAVHGGHSEVVKVLLEKGANPLLSDSHGTTPVALAKAEGKTEIANLLQAPRPAR